ncbi:hypothetical protein LC087_19135 (plasmid) [Bacillus carboniphilus]|uniref:Uncharacterized protein n=1 Tax=Bacillus carboniphilus TaxID=86663 RepID=A0ABY9K061_9BACI|nr:hypothetical protein [Bacillus carboniphilus]WLR44423.1 hypothetical protein LC087_19135 [Bacillus carboniphilus]
MEIKLMPFWEGETINGEIPKNILEYVQSTFTRFHYEFADDNKVVVKVPETEMVLIANVVSEIRAIVDDLSQENSALAKKLARKFKI